jgi:hypothetical protein
MPYMLIHHVKNGKVEYAVKNKQTGKNHGWTTKAKAEAQMRLLQGIEHGLIPRSK